MKKPKTVNQDHIDKFLEEAPDQDFLLMKSMKPRTVGEGYIEKSITSDTMKYLKVSNSSDSFLFNKCSYKQKLTSLHVLRKCFQTFFCLAHI